MRGGKKDKINLHAGPSYICTYMELINCCLYMDYFVHYKAA